MKTSRLLALTLLCAGSASSFAGLPVPLSGIFNTGVDDFGISQGDNATELHYTFAGTPPTGTVPIVATSAGGFPIGPWMGDSPTSAWITPSFDTTGNAGDYIYRTTFQIPAGVDPSQVYITGMLTSDNTTTGVLINGVATGITGSGNFPAFDPQFAIQKGFVVGLNTIDFVVNEATGSAGSGGFTGLRVEMSGGAGPVGHVAIPGLFNSGVVTTEGPVLTDNAPEPHFTLGGAVAGVPIVATAAGGFPIGPWLGDNGSSTWITPSVTTDGPEGDYTYALTFDMSGLNVSTAGIFGRWAVDNVGAEILLNGVGTMNFNGNGFGGWTEFFISPELDDTFLPGLNTLTFNVFNGPGAGPTGVRIEFLSATAAPIPEPSTALLALIGLGALWRRRP